MNSEDMAQLVVTTLDANKALAISNIDVHKLTNIADRIIVCTATSNRHAQSLAEKVLRTLREQGIRSLGSEGREGDDQWVLIDFGDVIAHIMLEEARQLYSLEKLWGIAERVREKSANEH